MPVSVRKDGRARRIAVQILGPPPCGLTDSFGNKKRFVKKKERNDAEELYQEKIDGEKIPNLQKTGYRW